MSKHSEGCAFAATAYVAAPGWDWGPRYAEIIEAARAGTYTPAPDGYWGSMADGVVALAPIASDVNADVVAAVEARRAEIIAGTFHVFSGPINDQDGYEAVAADEILDDGALLGMEFFVQGVIGTLG